MKTWSKIRKRRNISWIKFKTLNSLGGTMDRQMVMMMMIMMMNVKDKGKICVLKLRCLVSLRCQLLKVKDGENNLTDEKM